MKMLTLHWQHNGTNYNSLVSERQPLVIGRAPDCNIQQVAASVSNHHVQIYLHQGMFYVRNLTLKRQDRAPNPVAVNGQVINQSTLLNAGDRLQFGGMTFQVTTIEERKSGLQCPKCGRVIDLSYQDCPYDGTLLVNGETRL